MAVVTPDDNDIVPITLINASHFLQKDIPTRAVVGITCCLSILGSLLIILSFILQKKRTKAREILFHISLMDFGVSMANLIGLLVYFDRYYRKGNKIISEEEVPDYIDGLCKTQAFFAAFCTLASIYWTTALAGYLYIVILYRRNPKYSKYFVRFCYFLCYGLSLFISAWLISIGKLGFSPYNSTGWCSLIAKDPRYPPEGFTDQSHKIDMFISIFANDLWIFTATFMIVVLYIAIKGLLSNQLKTAKDYHNVTVRKFWTSMNSVDYKFILIPVIFVLLRMWSCIVNILFVYVNLKESDLNYYIIQILLYLSGIGDSAQGFTNAILFIVFTKSIRKIFIELLCSRCRDNARENYSTSEENCNIQQQLVNENQAPLLPENKDSSPFQSLIQDTSVRTTETKYSNT